jgi:hypothetical protein
VNECSFIEKLAWIPLRWIVAPIKSLVIFKYLANRERRITRQANSLRHGYQFTRRSIDDCYASRVVRYKVKLYNIIRCALR